MEPKYVVENLYDNVWTIRENRVRSFLLVGDERALLIDACVSVSTELADIVHGLTDKPIELLMTHSDSDHTGGIGGFEFNYLHPSEWENWVILGNDDARLRPIWEGDTFELGGLTLEVILVPGHTPGCISLLDRENRRLYVGDPVSDYYVYMFGKGRNLRAYIAGLQKLEGMSDAFDIMHPCHGTVSIGKEWIQKRLVAAQKLLAGELKGEPDPRGRGFEFFEYDGAKIYYIP